MLIGQRLCGFGTPHRKPLCIVIYESGCAAGVSIEMIRFDRHIVAGALLSGAVLMSVAPTQAQAPVDRQQRDFQWFGRSEPLILRHDLAFCLLLIRPARLRRRHRAESVPPGGSVRLWRIGVTIAATVLITIGAGSLACPWGNSARSGHAPNAGGRGIVTSSFPPRCAEIDDTPRMLGAARSILRSGVPRGTGVERPRPCLELQFRSQHGPGRCRIVDGAAFRTPRFVGTVTGF